MANNAVETNSGSAVDRVEDLPVTNDKSVVERLYVFDGENFVPYFATEKQTRGYQSRLGYLLIILIMKVCIYILIH